MKFLFKILVIFMTMVIAFQSCRDSDEPPPARDYKPYSSKDSALFCEILKSAYGNYLDRYCAVYHVKLDSIPSWSNSGCTWRWFEDLGERRIIYICLFDRDAPKGQFPGKVPSTIWDLDCLMYLKVWGRNFLGEIPPRNGKANALKYVYIHRTGITKLHADLFNLPSPIELRINFNESLEELPEGMEDISWNLKDNPSVFDLSHNNLTGEIPVYLNQIINFRHNNFTSINWDLWKEIDFEKDIRNYTSDFMCGPSVEGNRLSGDVPDYILADTFALFHTYFVTQMQQDGYGLSGFPPIDTIRKMRAEVLERNPELKENLKFLLPNNLQ